MNNPIAFLGSHILGLAFPAAIFSIAFFLVGVKKNRQGLVIAGQRATWATFLLISFSVCLLIGSFLNNNFSLSYVSRYSSISLPFFFKLTGLWAGLDGSILFWTWLVSLYSVIVLTRNRKDHPVLIPWINATLMFIVLFFLTIILFANNPFTPLESVPADGMGLNPLLQNIAMVIHPPSLYLGFTGFSVPFAFVMAALITRRLNMVWIEATRNWVITAWLFLTLGLILGGAWAYVELGWGGFWAWDPVENAALMPWLVATAYLHSVMIQKKRGMLMIWNIVLIILTYILTIFGTYLTRSGIVESVHAFSESNLGPYFLIFMGFVLSVSFLLILTRLPELKNQNTLQSYLSKESAFLLNNVILLVAAFTVLWGTLFPTLSEAVTGQRISVGPPFFNKIMAPVGLALLLLMGIGPMISWKRSTLQNLKNNLLGPVVFGLIAAVVTALLGVREWYALASAGLIALVFGTLYLEFSRGIKASRIQKNLSFGPAFVDLMIHSNRRYGGYIIHIGVLFLFIGIAGTVFKSEADFQINQNESFDLGGYHFTYLEPEMKESEHKSDMIAKVSLERGGSKLAILYPAKSFYKKSQQPTTEVDMYHAAFEDVYLVLGNINEETKQAEFRVILNPLISFMWLGALVIFAGAFVVLLPRISKGKNSGAVVPVILICLSLAFSATGYAQMDPPEHHHVDTKQYDAQDPFINRTASDPDLQRLKGVSEKLLCKCGGCVRTDLRVCTCDNAKKERARIFTMMKDGQSDDQILQSFIEEYGSNVLTVPPETGFFNVGYRAPLVILFACLAFTFAVIKVWSSRFKPQAQAATPASASLNDPYAQKLIQELKDFTNP